MAARRCGIRWPRSTRYRHRFEATPETLTNPILLGSLLAATGLHRRGRAVRADSQDGTEPEREPRVQRSGRMPLPRRDVERLRQILGLQRRLLDSRRRRAPAAR